MRAYEMAMSASWAMLPERVEELLAIAARETDPTPEALEAYRASRADNGERLSIRGNVGILDVKGPMFKGANLMTAFSGATSYQTLRRDLQVALDDSSIDAIMLRVDSPGGEVSGCDELAAAIYAARGKKPMTAYVSGMGCSAAYWLASAADRIVASDAAIIGSIGVVIGVTDRTKAEERAGVSRIEYVSSQSPGKRSDHGTDEGKARIQKMVDDLGAVFVSAVAKHRGVTAATVINEFGQGGVEIGANALKRRMVDEVGQFEAALSALAARGRSAKGTRSTAPAATLPAMRPAALAALPAVQPTASLPKPLPAASVDDTQQAVSAVKARYTAFAALEDRDAAPAVYAHLRDETDVGADEAARLLKAVRSDIAALARSVIDPVTALDIAKARAGTLGTEGYALKEDGSLDYSGGRAGGGEALSGWKAAAEEANRRFGDRGTF